MEKYTIHAAQQFSEERFTKINIIRNKRSVVFLLNFLPGQHMKLHNHPVRELYLHVLDGSGVFILEDKEFPVEQGDVIYCQAKDKLGFTNTGEEKVSIYATMTKLIY